MLKTLVLLVGFVAVAYVALVRNRGWHVDHYAPAARRAHFIVCLGLAVALASAAVYLLRDPIVCPRGATYRDAVSTKTRAGKWGLAIECRTDNGVAIRGSTFSGVIAWLGVLVLGFAGSSAVWRRLGPPALPEAPPEPLPLGAPTDRRERRQQRKRDEREEARRRARR